MFLSLTTFLTLGVGTLQGVPQPATSLEPTRRERLDGATRPFGFGLPREAAPLPEGLELFPTFCRHEVPAPDVEWLRDQDSLAVGGPRRIGVVVDLPGADSTWGLWTPLAHDRSGWVWTATFAAPGARGLRLRIPNWNPPSGAALYLRNARDRTERFGPLDGRQVPRGQAYWTPVIYGDVVEVAYVVPSLGQEPGPPPPFRVDGLLYQYAGPGGPQTLLDCHEDVSCQPTFQFAADGVGLLTWVHGGQGLICSGSMINRSPSDLTPLLLTAEHCEMDEASVATLTVTWFFQSLACDDLPPGVGTLPQTAGLCYLREHPGSDHALIGLEDDIPSGVTYLGWDSTLLLPFQVVSTIGHPDGSHKRIAIGGYLSPGICAVLAAQTYDWAQSTGTTEGGSSGGPTIDLDLRIRGVHSCSLGICFLDNLAQAGRFSLAFSTLSPFLDPHDPIFVDGTHVGTETGSSGSPFDTVTEATWAVIGGSDVWIQSANYLHDLPITKPMTLHSLGGSVVIR